MELVIVGSSGYDDIETPVGKVSGLLGGSAIYSGLSAAFHARDLVSGLNGDAGGLRLRVRTGCPAIWTAVFPAR